MGGDLGGRPMLASLPIFGIFGKHVIEE